MRNQRKQEIESSDIFIFKIITEKKNNFCILHLSTGLFVLIKNVITYKYELISLESRISLLFN